MEQTVNRLLGEGKRYAEVDGAEVDGKGHRPRKGWGFSDAELGFDSL